MSELENLPEDELQDILRLIKAKKATYHHPLAFVQEIMRFKAVNEENNTFSYAMTISDRSTWGTR
jgi:hypothetical protein